MSQGRRARLLAAAGFAFFACDPSTVFIDPTGKTCTDPLSPCPTGWACVPALDGPETICWPIDDAGSEPVEPADGGEDAGDSGILDSGILDSGIKDSGVQDSGVKDSGPTPDSGLDSGVPDSGPVDAGPCKIGGKTYAPGTMNPTDGCQECESALSTTAWTSLADGTTCSTGVCASGICAADCFIGGQLVDGGAADPTNACATCQPGTSTTGYSNLPNGSPCGGTNLCSAGACSSVCNIDGGIVPAAQTNPADACEACEPATSNSKWSVVADGTSCGTGQVCLSGTCSTECYISGQAFDAGTIDSANACLSCQPSAATTSWSNVADGTPCGGTQLCSGGVCSSVCDIGNQIFTSGEANPADACQECEPSTSNSSWTQLATGASCGSGMICVSGTCSAECDIGGNLITANTVNPSNSCQECLPASSTNGWSNAPNGTGCGGPDICANGACIYGCAVGGLAVDAGSSPAGNPCVTCNPTISSTSFTNLPNDAGCGTGMTCSNGICCGGTIGTLTCDGKPVDTCLDDLNCGYCGNNCSAPNGCFAGQCQLPLPLPTARDGLAAATGPDQQIYTIGGYIDATTTVSNVVEIFNPRTNVWTTGPVLPTAVDLMGATANSEGIFVFGGLEDPTSGTSANFAQFLNVSTQTWSKSPLAPTQFAETYPAVGPSGVVYIPGGYGGSPQELLKFTPTGTGAGGSWTNNGPQLPFGTISAGVAAGSDGTIYTVDGTNNFVNPVNDTQILSPGAVAWKLLSNNLPTARCDTGTGTDSAGNIYVIGGDNCAFCCAPTAGCTATCQYAIYAVMEYYSPTTGTWNTGSSLPNGDLTQFGYTTGPDGRFYVIGGWNGISDQDDMQVYDPVTQTWIP